MNSLETNNPHSKLCSVCGEFLPLTSFYASRTGAYGRMARCKVCDKAKAALYRAANAEQIGAKKREWYLENLERERDKARIRGRENYEKNKPKQAAYRAKNTAKCRAASAQWRLNNLERYRAVNAAWRAKNIERVREARIALRALGRRELLDSYLVSLLGVPAELIPPELIELKRVQLQITRKLKELKK